MDVNKRGELYKRSEWLKQWNQRHVIISPALIQWQDGNGRQTGSCALDRNACVSTTIDGRLVVQTSRGREVQFCCDNRADLEDWLRAVQEAARPAVPGGLPRPSLSEHLPPNALLARDPSAEALLPPPPQLLSKDAIGAIDWGKMVYRPTRR